MEGLAKERAIAKGAFTRKVKVMNSSLNNQEPLNILKAILDEVNTAFLRIEESNNKLISEATTETEIETFNQYILPIEQERVNVNSKYYRLEVEQIKVKQIEESKKFCVNKLSAPLFNGDM